MLEYLKNLYEKLRVTLKDWYGITEQSTAEEIAAFDGLFSLGVNIVAGLIIAIVVLFRNAILGFFQFIFSKFYEFFAQQYRIYIGKDVVIQNSGRNSKSKFPVVGDFGWYSTFNDIQSQFQNHQLICLNGPVHSGKDLVAKAALKDFGFPATASEEDCSFVVIESGNAGDTAGILDEILRAYGDASADTGRSAKKERIRHQSQFKYCLILVQDADKLSHETKLELATLFKSMSERSRIIVLSTEPQNEFEPCLTLSMQEMRSNDLESLIKNSKFSAGFDISDSDKERLLAATGSLLAPCYMIIEKSTDIADIRKNLTELEAAENGVSSGHLMNIVSKSLATLGNDDARILSHVAQLGGRASWKLINKVYGVHNSSIEIMTSTFSRSLIFDVYPDKTNGFIAIKEGARALVSNYKRLTVKQIEALARKAIRFFDEFNEMEGLSQNYEGFEVDVHFVHELLYTLIQRQRIRLAYRLYKSTCELMFNRGFFQERVDLGRMLSEAQLSEEPSCDYLWVTSTYASVLTLLGENSLARAFMEEALNGVSKVKCHNEILRSKRAIASTYYREGAAYHLEALDTVNNVLNDPLVDQDATNLIDAIYLKLCLEVYRSGLKSARGLVDQMKSACDESGWDRAKYYCILEEARLDAFEGNLELALQKAIASKNGEGGHDDLRHTARCNMLIGTLKMGLNRKHPMSDFDGGKKQVEAAKRQLESFKMNNEYEEAKSILRESDAIFPFFKLPFKIRYSDYPIGGD